MNKPLAICIFFFLSLNIVFAQTTVDCSVGPENINFCYDSNVNEEFIFVSSDGSSLNLTVNSGNVENTFDEFIVLDTNGTELFNGYGNAGDLAGLTFQSTGDEITVQVTPDFSVDCQGSGSINPIDITVSCATCTNPQVDFNLVDDCLNAPQFFVEADVQDLGSATDLDITDNQGNPAQTATTAGVLTFGPYLNGTQVELTAANNQDVNCQVTSGIITQDNCTTNLVDCAAGPVNTTFCYDSNVDEEFIYISSDGSSLNLTVNSGNVENNFDEFIVLDTNGTELYNGYGNAGDLSGLTFQSTGDEITVQVTPDFSVDCQGSGGINPIDITVSCATCTNPQVDFNLVDDCLNAPQFFVEADVQDLGSATDLDITDNQGNPAQTATAAGVITFGPYPNGTQVELTATNNQDVNCQVTSAVITQDNCTTNLVDCAVGPVNTTFCYDSGVVEEFTYISSDGSPLNLTVNSGNVENNFDEFIVLDTNGTELFNGYGNAGDLAGLTFQSTGDEITVQVTPDGSVDCQGSGGISPIDITVSCATCTNPQVDFNLVDDCLNGPQFLVEADVQDLGSATDLDITDNQGNPAQTATAAGVLTFGPYPNGTQVELTAANNQDVNCQITSGVITQDVCTTNLVDCAVGPVNTTFCYDSGVIEELTYVSSDGTPLNLTVNSGNVENNFDEFIVLDTNGTELFNGYGNAGDLSGLTFQSTGNEITVQVTPDGSIDCQGSTNIDPIDITVSCATCINPQVEYSIIGECDDNSEGFSVEVDILDLGSASALDITNNQGDPLQNITSITTLTYGPYPLNTDVVFTIENIDDPNCIITSPSQNLFSCDCFRADPFCAPDQGESLIFENVSDGSSAPQGIDYDCLGSQPDPVWFFMQIEDGGDLDFEIIQNTQFDNQGNPTGTPLDVDFIAWGPFDNTQDACNDLSQNTQIGCSFSPDPEENFSITNAQNGEIYIVLITNFNGDPGFISLGQTNEGVPGSGSTNCDIVLQNQVTVCESNGVTLTATDQTADQYQWLVFNETSQQFDPITGENQPTLTVSEEGVYQIFTLNGTDVSTEEFDVTFISEPENSLPDQIGVCSNGTETLDATVDNPSEYSSFTHQWFLNGNALSGETNPTLDVTQPGNYSVEITTTTLNADNDGNDLVCVNQFDINVTSADFTVDLGGNQTFCDNTPQTITANVNGADATNATYSWSNGENTSSIEVNSSDTYEVTVTIDGCPVTESVIYTFADSPQYDLGADQNLCEGETITLDASLSNSPSFTSVSYEWSDANGVITGETQNTLDITTQGSYSVEVTTTTTTTDGQTFDCVTTDTVQINGAVFSVDLGGNQTFCDNTPQTITATVNGADATNATYSWSNGESTSSIEVSSSDTYEVTVTIDGCSNTESVIYTFADSPQYDLGADQILCEGETITLDASLSNSSSFTSVSYEWSDANGVITGETQNTLDVTTQGAYSVEVTTTTTTADGQTFDCVSTDTVQINGAVFSVDLGGNQTFCDAGTQTITANINAADATNATYLWNTGETTASIDVNQSDVYEVTVTIEGCPITESVEYIFNESPIISLGPDTQTCSASDFILNATPSNATANVNYSWTFNGNDLNVNSATINPANFGFGLYEVNVFFDDPNCNTTDAIELSLRDDVTVFISTDDPDNLFCPNELVTFTANIENALLAEADFEWFADGVSQASNDKTLESFQITDNGMNGSQTIAVEVRIGNDCIFTDELEIALYDVDSCVISQGLSPNGDGQNDNLDLRFLDDRTGIASLEVYNRYGQQVYEKQNYRDEFFGQSDNGNALETGTYFYVIKFEQEDETFGIVKKGWIYINTEQ